MRNLLLIVLRAPVGAGSCLSESEDIAEHRSPPSLPAVLSRPQPHILVFYLPHVASRPLASPAIIPRVRNDSCSTGDSVISPAITSPLYLTLPLVSWPVLPRPSISYCDPLRLRGAFSAFREPPDPSRSSHQATLAT